MKLFRKPNSANKGFTIIELMIALSVFSVILLVASVIMIQISKWYSKGVNASNLQNVSRNITADLTSALQFSGVGLQSGSAAQSMNGRTETVRAYCLGKVRYTYILGSKLGSDNGYSPVRLTNHVLWRDVMRNTSACQPRNITAVGTPTADALTAETGYEMVGNSMRLTRFSLAEQPSGSGIYALDLNMAYGDNDLVINTAGKATCRSGPGSEYCSASNLRTVINRRLQ